MMDLILLILFCLFVLFIVFPCVVYICVKWGTYAFYKAKELVKRDHLNF